MSKGISPKNEKSGWEKYGKSLILKFQDYNKILDIRIRELTNPRTHYSKEKLEEKKQASLALTKIYQKSAERLTTTFEKKINKLEKSNVVPDNIKVLKEQLKICKTEHIQLFNYELQLDHIFKLRLEKVIKLVKAHSKITSHLTSKTNIKVNV